MNHLTNKRYAPPVAALLFTLLLLLIYLLYGASKETHSFWMYEVILFFIPSSITLYLMGEIKNLTRPISFKLLIKIIFLSLFVSALVNLLGSVQNYFFPLPDWIQNYYEHLLESHGWKDKLRQCFTMGLVPAISEEVLFRGFLQTVLVKSWGKQWGIGLSALLFAVSHLNPWFLPLYILMGIFLGILKEKYHNIYLSMLAHFINNTLALFLL